MSLKAFKRCVNVQMSQRRVTRAAAESICRGEQTSYNPYPLPKHAQEAVASGSKQSLKEVGPASSVGPGWRSQGANIGTDAVVLPDPIETAEAWRASLHYDKGLLSAKHQQAWAVHAERLGLSPEAASVGWKHLASKQEMGPLAVLHTIFNETVAFGGYRAPIPSPAADPQQGDDLTAIPVAKKEKRSINTKPVAERISTNIVMPQAAQVGNIRGQAQTANDGSGFPFRTQAAQKVWEMAQNLILLYPTKNAEEILALAIRKSGVLTYELTPEDDQLLKMAIDSLQNGPARTNVRTGGAPGGPFRSTGADHFLGLRGTFNLP